MFHRAVNPSKDLTEDAEGRVLVVASTQVVPLVRDVVTELLDVIEAALELAYFAFRFGEFAPHGL